MVAQAAAQAGLPAPTVVGVRFAPEPGRGANAVPARPRIRTGSARDYQFVAVFGSDGHDSRPNGPVLAVLATDPAVAGLTDIRIAAAGSGATPVLAHSYKLVGAPVPLVLMSGVPPSRDSDLVLASATASRLGARVGSVVPLTGDRGIRRMRVMGIGFTMESTTSPTTTAAGLPAARTAPCSPGSRNTAR
jgi:hypothetical protein